MHDTLGYRAPFILGLIICTFDLLGRLLVIEKHEAKKWLETKTDESSSNGEVTTRGMPNNCYSCLKPHRLPRLASPTIATITSESDSDFISFKTCIYCLFEHVHIRVSFLFRDRTTFANLMDSITFTILEPTLPLRLQDVYGFTSLKVGLIYLAAVVPSIICKPLFSTCPQLPNYFQQPSSLGGYVIVQE